jgi:rod shape determining protein RodA
MNRLEIQPRFLRTEEASWTGRYLQRLDWTLAGAAVVLSLFGILFIYSATSYGGQGHSFLTRQSVALAAGVGLMVFLSIFPYQVLLGYWKWIYAFSAVLLIMVLVFGVKLRGSKSWFDLGFIYFQPVEVTRLGLAVSLAAYAEQRFRDMRDWTGLHRGLILMQPDLSSALGLGPMALAVLYTAGGSVPFLLGLVATAAIALGIPLAKTYFRLMGDRFADGTALDWLRQAFLDNGAFLQLWGGVCLALIAGWWFLRRWRVFIPGFYLLCGLGVVLAGVGGSFGVSKALKDYQRKRLIAFIEPDLDPLGAGYNIRQSEIAVGSGKLFGKGYLGGSQSQLGFLPERHTDFIFSTVAEEIGFFGSVFVLALYFWIVWRAFDIAANARDLFGRCLAVALGTLFGFTGMVNIGMAMGLMPVTGVPLPFLSYGGSALVGAFAGVGLLLSIHQRRYIL